MITKTVEATYEDGVLKLDEPVELATRSRVRVKIEFPAPEGITSDTERESRLSRLSPEKRELLDRIRALRDRAPRVDFDIVESLREIREHG